LHYGLSDRLSIALIYIEKTSLFFYLSQHPQKNSFDVLAARMFHHYFGAPPQQAVRLLSAQQGEFGWATLCFGGGFAKAILINANILATPNLLLLHSGE
jgi:hypothetical protein